MVNVSNDFIDLYMLRGSVYLIMGFLPMIVWQLAPASRWGLSCAESACVTDLKGPNLLVVLQGRPSSTHIPNYGPGFALGPFLCRIRLRD